MMMLFPFVLLCVFSKVVNARELGVRILLNQGEMQEGAACSVKEFEVVTKALEKQATKSESFALAEEFTGRRALNSNCGYICCGFPYGYCGIYQPACAGYPTATSNKLYCKRRELNDEANMVVIVGEAVEPEKRSLRGLQEDHEALQEVDQCRQLKKEAVIAISSVLDKIDDACADVVLLPTRLQCFVTDTEN